MRLKHPGRVKVQEDLFQSIRKLARLRAATPALRRGVLTGLLVEDGAYAFARVTDESRVVVVLNGANASAELHVPLEASGIPNGRICWGPHRRGGTPRRFGDRVAAPLRRDLSVTSGH